jgi:uroporphyrinogen decarboxylase
MNSRERLLTTLNHKNPDRVPYDLAGTHVSGIHVTAYRNLCEYLNIDPGEIEFADVIQQVVVPNAKIVEHLQVDTCGLFPLCSHNWNVVGEDKGDYLEYIDEWGFTQHFPKDNGFWWSLVKPSWDGAFVEVADFADLSWPVANLPERVAGLRQRAELARKQGKAVVLKGLCAGLFEMGQRVRGMENFMCDMLADPDIAKMVLDKIIELKIAFWDMALEELGDLIDVVVETDDYGTQESQLVSPELFRELFKPRLNELFTFIKNKISTKKIAGETSYLFFHSCGNVRPILPDFIEIGVDILNPVHVGATDMDPVSLKSDFGSEITFWGGGVETQNILPYGTPAEVREDVKRNVETLMVNGGFVFNTIHNIQAEVPPENIMAMVESLHEYGKY